MRFTISSPKQRALLVIALITLSLVPLTAFISLEEVQKEISGFLSSADLEISTFNITEETPKGIYVSGILLINSSRSSNSDSFFRINPTRLDVDLWKDDESLGSIRLLLRGKFNSSKSERTTEFSFSTFLSFENAKNGQIASEKFFEELFLEFPLVLNVSGTLSYEFLGIKDSASFSNSLAITGLRNYTFLGIASINTETSYDDEIDVVVQIHNPFQVPFSIDGFFQVFVNTTRIGLLDPNALLFLNPGINTFTIPLALLMSIDDLVLLLTSLSNFMLILKGTISIIFKYHQFPLNYSLNVSFSDDGSILDAQIINISSVSIDLETLSIALLLSTNITNYSPLILRIVRANISIYTSDWEFLANGTWKPEIPATIDAYGFLLIYDLPILATNVSLGDLLQVGLEQRISLEICLTISIASAYVDVCLLVPSVEL